MNNAADIRIEPIAGDAVHAFLGDLARLRMTVFREWPYLYDGDAASEEAYLAGFSRGKGAIIVAAFDGDEIVGAATGSPLQEHTEEFGPLFHKHGHDPDDIFYCGESVLLAAYRGRGIGHAFFDHREQHARTLNAAHGYRFKYSAFCGVVRDAGDPRAPTGYRPLDGFWEKRGYRKVDGLIGHYEWREIGEQHETRKDMQFWMRTL